MPDVPDHQVVAKAMFAADSATQHLGIEIESCGVGIATAKVRVQRFMLNGHNVCHGGYIFLLADTAFAYACNNANIATVAAGCSIEFLAPAALDDTLLAKASERTQRGRQGIYDIDVYNQRQELIAVFRGKSARIAGQIVKESADASTQPRP
jgi:acyl-CoA thioesterase